MLLHISYIQAGIAVVDLRNPVLQVYYGVRCTSGPVYQVNFEQASYLDARETT